MPRERMGEDAARAFDEDVRALVGPYASGGVLALGASASVRWGKPATSAT
ncbi:MAG: hypothetical protein WEB52_12005 [Dehalococcoidia bacterium]